MSAHKVNDFVMYKGEKVRITAKFPNNRIHISNMNMPLCGSISKIVEESEVNKPKKP